MLNIRTGRSVKQVPDEDIVIFVSSLPHMASCGVHFLFTNQHAYTEGADFYATPDKLEEIDWALLQARDFKRDPDDPGKLSRYMAEALVWRHVPLNALQGVCRYSPVVERQLKAEVASRRLSFNVAVQRNWYF